MTVDEMTRRIADCLEDHLDEERLFIEAWKRMPLPMTRFIGPMVARYLG